MYENPTVIVYQGALTHPQTFEPQSSTPDLYIEELSRVEILMVGKSGDVMLMVEKFMVEVFMVEKFIVEIFIVEKFMVEKSGVEVWS